jgi:hypothetical protein
MGRIANIIAVAEARIRATVGVGSIRADPCASIARVQRAGDVIVAILVGGTVEAFAVVGFGTDLPVARRASTGIARVRTVTRVSLIHASGDLVSIRVGRIADVIIRAEEIVITKHVDGRVGARPVTLAIVRRTRGVIVAVGVTATRVAFIVRFVAHRGEPGARIAGTYATVGARVSMVRITNVRGGITRAVQPVVTQRIDVRKDALTGGNVAGIGRARDTVIAVGIHCALDLDAIAVYTLLAGVAVDRREDTFVIHTGVVGAGIEVVAVGVGVAPGHAVPGRGIALLTVRALDRRIRAYPGVA